MEYEVELKLGFCASDFDAIKQHPIIKQYQTHDWDIMHAVSNYYDTADMLLRDMGYSLRIRNNHHYFVQTLKQKGDYVAGLYQRREWEWPIQQQQLDFNLIEDEQLRQQLIDWGDKLLPLFHTEFERYRSILTLDNNTNIEFAIDQGKIISAGQEQPICEIELELKSGITGYLYDVALELAEHIPLQIEARSKAARAIMQLDPIVKQQYELLQQHILDKHDIIDMHGAKKCIGEQWQQLIDKDVDSEQLVEACQCLCDLIAACEYFFDYAALTKKQLLLARLINDKAESSNSLTVKSRVQKDWQQIVNAQL